MMEVLSSGLTWGDLQAQFANQDEYRLLLKQVKRRSNKSRRAREDFDERTLWRCFVQRTDGCQLTTVYRKNIRFEGDDLSAEVVSDRVIISINHAIA
jgi:hypothetical protein